VRVYTNDAMKASGTTITTWGNAQLTQSLPSYCGVQEIDSSTDWVYVRSTGLGSHVLGPWYNTAARTVLFVNVPVNQKMIYRIPRNPTVPVTKSRAQGEIGMCVDGVRIFDGGDAFSYSYANSQDATAGNNLGQGDGVWNREAWSNEGLTMDPAYAHQQNTGRYHYHSSPIALRYLLGDHVDFDSVAKTYGESTNAPTQHSPILGWLQDGFPLYGPYGYSSPSNAASGIRRMVSGYVPRDGTSGSTNLNSTGRHSLPAWRARADNRSATLAATEYGPNVSGTYPIGHYLEDYDYLGDLALTQGADFDLDEYNGRWCVTPEFPDGTYAYFCTISSNGTPAFPYNMGKLYYGDATGGLVTSIMETIATNFLGNTNLPAKLNSPAVNDGTVTLTWSAVEGGTYRVEATSDLSNWTALSTNVAPSQDSGQYTNVTSEAMQFYRVARTAVASFDPVSGTTGGGGGGATITMSPLAGNRGQAYTVTATLSASATPAVPPANAPVQTFTVGTIAVTGVSHPAQYTVTGTLTIPAGATVGGQTITITFAPPPGQANGPTYTQANGFTIN
jgi:YHYH protein